MTSFMRRCLEIAGVWQKPKIAHAEYERFFQSPVWLALRQSVAEQLDGLHKQCISPMVNERQIYEARGAIRALSWILEAKDELMNRVEKNHDRVLESRQMEERLTEVFELFSREQENVRRRKRAGNTGTSSG